MHKTKKKSKTAKLPKPIKVKKEKSDEDRLPQPMTHYIDDRLEMVKQIFNTLKPKTIVNLAPEFLKTQALEEIEEACLNELLCISTKRLKSIITSTKCPTDTESSDNDSDVERQEEHISLEEISSDSEIEGSGSKKVKKKKTSKAVEEAVAGKKDTPNPDNPEDGQISVLELLELQARARAIRSQLALEPVTKIEVDSDGEKRNKEDKGKVSEKDGKVNKNERKRLSSERQSRDSAKVSRTNGTTDNQGSKAPADQEVEKRTTKKIKLKRTHKTSTNTEKGHETQEKQDSEKKNGKSKEGKEKSNKTKEYLTTEIKKEKSSRSPSPDVIPIVAEPETLLITDSSDGEDEPSNNKIDAEKATNEKSTNESATEPQRERKNTETEAQVNKDKENASPQKSDKPAEIVTEPKPNRVIDNVSLESSTENTQDSSFKMSDRDDTQDSNIPEETKSNDLKSSSKEKSKTADEVLTKKANDETNSANHSDDDQNDDVISLGGDLENEMNEQLENEVNAMKLPLNKKSKEDTSQDTNNKSQDESQPEEAISLESSEDEHVNDNQSWHSRYMKSSKVSKVLAASRLGKRVRDKIKKSKHSKKETSHENSDIEKEKSKPAYSSKHEDGSIEQYKELLEIRQRKSSQNN
ncbi:transcriptional regulator ATRX homolog [Calliphora vicina]|uniref:transcriptional regulator ATRX homolog n=1 Tax=Calliphora vicina TaxID=7373 RepID=UPI00325B48AD